jgi:hypothetical protein
MDLPAAPATHGRENLNSSSFLQMFSAPNLRY